MGNEYPAKSLAQECQHQIFKSHYLKGDTAAAYRQFIAFRNSYPDDPRMRYACELLVGAYNHQTLTTIPSAEIVAPVLACSQSHTATAILWERAWESFDRKDYSTAQKYFQRIMLNLPNGSQRQPQAYFYNAECYFQLNHPEQAVSAYRDFLQNFPNNRHAPTAMARMVDVLVQKEKCSEAAQILEDLRNRFPTDSSTKDAQNHLKRCGVKAENRF